MSDEELSDEEYAAKVRAQMSSPEATRSLLKSVFPAFDPNHKTLVYILPQTSRIGHFVTELQILETLYKPHYERIIVVGEPMDRPGTNRFVPELFGDGYRFVETRDEAVRLMGLLVDGGIGKLGPLDLLLRSPHLMHVQFFRHMIAGGAPARLRLTERIAELSESCLRANGIDPAEPFVLLHIRTMQYLAKLGHNRHRATDPAPYGAAVHTLLDKDYRVFRIGEPDVEIGVDDPRYHDVNKLEGADRFLDLYLAAKCRFGLMQDSGPIWLVAAFGNKVLRTNCPHAALNYPYLDEPNFYKHYRVGDSASFLTYQDILERRIPLFKVMEEFDERGIKAVDHTADDLVAATEQMVRHMEDAEAPNPAHRTRVQALGEALQADINQDAELVGKGMNFFGMAHGRGWIPEAIQNAQPDYFS